MDAGCGLPPTSPQVMATSSSTGATNTLIACPMSGIRDRSRWVTRYSIIVTIRPASVQLTSFLEPTRTTSKIRWQRGADQVDISARMGIPIRPKISASREAGIASVAPAFAYQMSAGGERPTQRAEVRRRSALIALSATPIRPRIPSPITECASVGHVG